jgi:TRAP transporter TAXI family solute receptor
MPKKFTTYSPLKRAAISAALMLLLVAALWSVIRVLSPTPPRTLTLSTGAPDGAYHQFGLKYQALMKESGVSVELQTSGGSVENLQRLNDGKTSVAFVQGGLGLLSLDPLKDDTDTGLRSLATVGFEPVWLFTRKLNLSAGMSRLGAARVGVGAPGSGNYKVAVELLGLYGVADAKGNALGSGQIVKEGGMVAARKLMSGELDAVILVASLQSESVTTLLADPSVELVSLAHVEGLSRRLPYFQLVVLKRGSVNPAQNLPARDIPLLATTANLVIADTVHPALAYLLLEAARQIHSHPTLLNKPGEFPSPVGTDFPLSEESERYFKNGRPFLQRYLPFWLANLVQRIVLIVVPLAAILIPVFKFLPSALQWRQRIKLYRRYGELKFLENDISARNLGADEVANAHAQLTQIERDILATRFSVDFADRVYTLRQHVDFVREKLKTI